jgi:hypothetical protein
MAQNTALQELIEEIEGCYDLMEEEHSQTKTLKWVVQQIRNRYLSKERQDIIDGFNQGYREGETDSNDNGGKLPIDVCQYDDANNYFIQTFTQNK